MTEVQTITKQLATYESKVNATEYERRRAVQEIEHCRKERARLEVLRELGEVDQAELDALDERVHKAIRVRDEATSQLQLSGRALGELQARLEEARKHERTEAKRQSLLDYRATVVELLELLGPVAERYEALGCRPHRTHGHAVLAGGSAARSAED